MSDDRYKDLIADLGITTFSEFALFFKVCKYCGLLVHLELHNDHERGCKAKT